MTPNTELGNLLLAANSICVRLEIERKERGKNAIFPCAAMIDGLRDALNASFAVSDAAPAMLEALRETTEAIGKAWNAPVGTNLDWERLRQVHTNARAVLATINGEVTP